MKGVFMVQKSYAGLGYDEVVRKYAKTVASACLMKLNNWADAEDCFQNTFLKLYTSSPAFENENHLKAWLIRVAVNECKNTLRTRGRTLSLDSAAEVPVFMKEADRDTPPALLMKLKPKHREVMYLYYCEQYKVAEIARILGKNENTIKTLLRRGREEFRKRYGGDDLE